MKRRKRAARSRLDRNKSSNNGGDSPRPCLLPCLRSRRGRSTARPWLLPLRQPKGSAWEASSPSPWAQRREQLVSSRRRREEEPR